jgi:hypothetical protein
MNVVYLWTKGDIVIPLAEPLYMEDCKMAVMEIQGKLEKGDPKPYYLCCDLCEDVFVNSIKLPCLRQITMNTKGFVNKDINHLLWIKATRPFANYIRLYITDDKGQVKSFEGKGLYCSLAFVRNQHEC